MRILILGGNGMIGHKMYQKLSLEYNDTWVTLRKNLNDYNYKSIYNQKNVIDNFDLTNFVQLKAKLDELKPNIIINACGITIRRGIENLISNTIILNSVLPHFLNEWVIENNQRLIHFSTDCVFSGCKGDYLEDDIPDSNDLYGKSKTLGEIKYSLHSITLRGSMIGRELENKTELLEWFLNQNDKTIKGFSNIIYSGITTNKMADIVLILIKNYPNLNGLFNVSAKSISKFDLLNLCKVHFNINTNIENDNSYISNKNLISSKLYNIIQIQQPDWLDLIVELTEDSKKYTNLYN